MDTKGRMRMELLAWTRLNPQLSDCRANAQQPKLFVGMILILIFAEALALYGLIGGCWGQEYSCEEICTPSFFLFAQFLTLTSACVTQLVSFWPPRPGRAEQQRLPHNPITLLALASGT